MKKILVTEDHPLVQAGIEHILSTSLEGVQVFTSHNLSHTLTMLANHRFELLVLDIKIPEGNNIDMIRSIRIRQPDIPILVCTSYEEELYAVPYLRAGVNGFINKSALNTDFLAAVKAVLDGATYVSSSLMQSAFTDVVINRRSTKAVTEMLNDNEMEISKYLMQGMSTKQIGEQTSRSQSSISNYKARIFEKLRVSNIVDLIAYFKMNG